MNSSYDVVIIGGGINGCGCAAEAAMRGLRVLLCEQDDLASKTSSNSSKLIHGGLRYLEQYDLALVKKSLNEQQTLMEIAPHLVHPLPFVLPHEQHNRSKLLLRAGLFLYDHLSHKNQLPNSRSIDRLHEPHLFNPLSADLTDGFLFYDCQTDDARLTVVNALLAKAHGAEICPQVSLIHAAVTNHIWHLTLKPKQGPAFQIQTKALINAAGPWLESVSRLLNMPLNYSLSLVKGSHIVVHPLYEGNQAYLLQHPDKRVIFVIPYHGYTLIGTTDMPYTGSLENIAIEPAEINYLSDIIHHYFNHALNQSDIIQTWSGVRPLLSAVGKDAALLSRNYVLHETTIPAPVITVYSGKITTYRQLAAEAIDNLKTIFPELRPSHSEKMPLPGATHHQMNLKAYQQYAHEHYHWLDETVLNHYLDTYGTLTEQILNNCQSQSDLGQAFTERLYEAEIRYLVTAEWAKTADDILWRRTKLGLSTNSDEYQAICDFLHASSTMS